MLTKYKIVVAHPDDEVLFFNSILEEAEKVIVSFGRSASRSVTKGREDLRESFPYDNVKFLWLDESDVLDPTTFCKQSVIREGLTVSRNADMYRKNYEKIISHLRTEINEGDTIFTHNPWGEYGHEEHVQVFSAVLNLKEELQLNIYVSGYVSNRSWELMTQRYDLLGKEAILGFPCQEFGEEYMSVFVRHNCWTWPATYAWPSVELFFPVKSDLAKRISSEDVSTAFPPLNMLSGDYRPKEPNKLQLMLKRMAPLKLKKLYRACFFWKNNRPRRQPD
jgi:LmbE family N-acetylglucosaminyl deacetylase